MRLMSHPATLPVVPIGRVCRCKLCEHGWRTRLPVGRLPLICPSCRSWYWQTDPALVSEGELERVKAFRRVGTHISKRKRK